MGNTLQASSSTNLFNGGGQQDVPLRLISPGACQHQVEKKPPSFFRE